MTFTVVKEDVGEISDGVQKMNLAEFFGKS